MALVNGPAQPELSRSQDSPPHMATGNLCQNESRKMPERHSSWCDVTLKLGSSFWTQTVEVISLGKTAISSASDRKV